MRLSLLPPISSHSVVQNAIRSRYILPSLLAADKAGIFSSLDQSPASSMEIARRFDMEHRSAETLLGLLTAMGLLARAGGKFHVLDVVRDFLLPDSPYYCGGLLEMCRSGMVNPESLYRALFENKAAYAAELDADNWDTAPNVEQLKKFTASMHSVNFAHAMGAAVNGDFTGVNRLLDVAGGSGCFCIAFALRFPDMDLVVMELPEVCALIPEYTRRYNLESRIGTLAADMFKDEWPDGFDTHFLSNIFHDWGPDKCRTLARNSFEALPPGGKIYLHEELVNDSRDGPLETMLYSMNMVAWTGEGKQYSLDELDDILSGAGFRDTRVMPTYDRFSLVVATKP